MGPTINEITGISATTGPTWVTPEYDPAGNMTTIPQPKEPTTHFSATYDAWNRMVRLTKPAEPPSSSSSSSSSSSGGGLSSSSAGETSSSSAALLETSSSSSDSSSSSSSVPSSSSSSSEPEELPVVEYEYDARRFRIRERTYTDGVLSETRDVYFTESWQAIEERIPPQTFPWAERQYVWGAR